MQSNWVYFLSVEIRYYCVLHSKLIFYFQSNLIILFLTILVTFHPYLLRHHGQLANQHHGSQFVSSRDVDNYRPRDEDIELSAVEYSRESITALNPHSKSPPRVSISGYETTQLDV